jgi:hypothetical protein
MDEDRRGKHPNSLANLKPVQPGQVLNPLGNNGRTYSVEYHKLSQEPVPEAVRLMLNKKFGAELIREGDTWARANAMSQHFEAVCRGVTGASQELREATEGKAVQRVELGPSDGAASEHPTFSIAFTDKLETDASPLELEQGKWNRANQVIKD